eukprot:CAMPEP_0185909052 /NCGR_PEP_ID=MMETSP0196C-20130402/10768_1 /TAXON_ID=2932 /ORGANISM="Alexandrium fundyense, Strain CCMP1719" /LENGTH=116 /DNA_ID=CAMNT_0028629451 /DNA_START=96 /DNA_END=443 /DNA_ORIENTATION=-
MMVRASEVPRRGRPQGTLCIGLLVCALWWASSPEPSLLGVADSAAFVGLVAPPDMALAPPATRGLVARSVGRDWNPGNVAKKQDFRAAAKTFGGGKKKKGKKEEAVKELPKIYRDS